MHGATPTSTYDGPYQYRNVQSRGQVFYLPPNLVNQHQDSHVPAYLHEHTEPDDCAKSACANIHGAK